MDCCESCYLCDYWRVIFGFCKLFILSCRIEVILKKMVCKIEV